MGNNIHSFAKLPTKEKETRKNYIEVSDRYIFQDVILYSDKFTERINGTNTWIEHKNDYVIVTKEFLQHLKEVTKDFISQFCSIGEHELCDNPTILYSAYITYLERHLDVSKGYFKFFMFFTQIKQQRLLYLLHSIQKVLLIPHVTRNQYIQQPEVPFTLLNDTEDYSKVRVFLSIYYTELIDIAGIVGIRLVKFPPSS